MMAGWKMLPFSDVIVDESGGNLKTPQSEFQPNGRFPIVDQGKALVAGYTDDPRRICRVHGPVIVFGDHTRCFKFVDFPFCMGADGVKVLRPRITADEKYLYHYLRNLRLPDAGYDRHFKYLKRADVILPPLADQKRIAAILDQAEALQAKRRQALVKLNSLNQSIFLEMFGDPLENPHRFPTSFLAEIIDPSRPVTYGILMPGPDQEGGVPYVRVVDMKDGEIDLTAVRRTTTAIAKEYQRSTLRKGDLLLSIRGHVGRLAVVPHALDSANITQDTARLSITRAKTRFICESLRTPSLQRWMAKYTKGVAVRGINLGDVKQMPIIVPPVSLQEDFEARVSKVERMRTFQKASLAKLDELFVSLQQRAFRGEL
jgi:type I restriction enzyme S subunit